MQGQKTWTSEKLFFESKSYFTPLIEDLKSAKTTIDLSTYIFDLDPIGTQVLEALMEKSKSGVRVKILVDGIGSPDFPGIFEAALTKANVEYRIYHPLPWKFSYFKKLSFKESFGGRFFRLFFSLNQRDHRKLCIIDHKTAWVGSINITDKNWRDLGVRITGSQLSILRKIFEYTWLTRTFNPFKKFKGSRQIWKKENSKELLKFSLVRFTATSAIRRFFKRNLLTKMKNSKDKIWLTTAYFVPPLSLLRSILTAAKKGIDVRIMVPRRSDVAIVPFLTRGYYPVLLKSGVKIFEYLPTMLHSKSIIIDNFFCLGSTNLNYRSYYHDQELDIELKSKESHAALKKLFINDTSKCEEVTSEMVKHLSFLERTIAIPLSWIRYWI